MIRKGNALIREARQGFAEAWQSVASHCRGKAKRGGAVARKRGAVPWLGKEGQGIAEAQLSYDKRGRGTAKNRSEPNCKGDV